MVVRVPLRHNMRTLLDSSWMKFGPAMRDSLDWPEPSALPSTDKQLAGQQSSGDAVSSRSASSIAVGCLSLLGLLGLLLFMLWRRRRSLEEGKLGLAGVIALEDLQDPERNCELLSSLRRNASQRRSQRRGGSPLPSSSSEQDVNDGVFLMVYLPPPYEHTLTRIARAASMSSRDGDGPLSPGLDPPHSPGLEPTSSPSLDPPSTPSVQMSLSSCQDQVDSSPNPGVDPSSSACADLSHSTGVTPPQSPGVDPPQSPGPLMTFSPGPETGDRQMDEIRAESETHD